MSLDKKDVRTKLSPEAHAVLAAIAEYNDKDIGEYASFLLERTLMGEVHAIKVIAERTARFGKARTGNGEPMAAVGHGDGIAGEKRGARK